MPSLSEVLDAIWRTPNRQMAWGRIPAKQVVGTKTPTPFGANDDYVVVKLASMFLKNSRVLWLKLSPLAHATITMAGRNAPKSETAVIGPAQFGDLAAAPADRSVILNQRVAGPSVWRGGDLVVAAGLFAVPKEEAAVQLLDTLGQLSALGVPGLAQGLQIAGIVKTGVEGLIGLKGTKPILGAKVALGDPANAPAGTEAAPCVLAGIAAAAAEVDFDKLWMREGRLWSGTSGQSLSPYEQNDHLLVSIERGPARQDWRGLPVLQPHEAAFDQVLRATDIDRKSAETRLNDAFVPFDSDLHSADELSNPDKDRIRGEVIAELKLRLQRKYDGLFGAASKESRSIGGIDRVVSTEGFDFLDVGDAGPEGAKPAKAGQLPF
jgi:hypothetical protein